jgi:hypothetical protein
MARIKEKRVRGVEGSRGRGNKKGFKGSRVQGFKGKSV